MCQFATKKTNFSRTSHLIESHELWTLLLTYTTTDRLDLVWFVFCKKTTGLNRKALTKAQCGLCVCVSIWKLVRFWCLFFVCFASTYLTEPFSFRLFSLCPCACNVCVCVWIYFACFRGVWITEKLIKCFKMFERKLRAARSWIAFF